MTHKITQVDPHSVQITPSENITLTELIKAVEKLGIFVKTQEDKVVVTDRPLVAVVDSPGQMKFAFAA